MEKRWEKEHADYGVILLEKIIFSAHQKFTEKHNNAKLGEGIFKNKVNTTSYISLKTMKQNLKR